jgi:hypothetical protein
MPQKLRWIKLCSPSRSPARADLLEPTSLPGSRRTSVCKVYALFRETRFLRKFLALAVVTSRSRAPDNRPFAGQVAVPGRACKRARKLHVGLTTSISPRE